MNTAVFTIVSKNYISYARTLLDSVAKVHPEYDIYLCLADRLDGYFDDVNESFKVITSDKIRIPNFIDMTLRYDIMEFNTAVKPFMFRWLFDNTDLDVVIYLDPDIHVYSRLDQLETELEQGASLVLTPHITRPLEDGKSPNDYHMLQSGVFNLGFMAARRCQETLSYIDWWGRRLMTHCASDVSNNLFTDQKWCDLAPCFLDRLKVLKDPGYNVAYWNLAQRKVGCTSEGEWSVDGQSLAFFHFSGISADQRRLVSKHQNRFEWDDIGSCQPLFEDYLDAMISAGWKTSKHWPYAYSEIPGAFKVPSLVRQLYRQENPQPLALDGLDLAEYLIDLCNKPAADILFEDTVRITKLMAFAHSLRPDLQFAFSLGTADGRCSFAHWFEIAGEREYGLPREMTQQSLLTGTASFKDKKKKLTGACYAILILLSRPIRKFAFVLPHPLRELAKSKWLRLRSQLLRLL